jgi:hypothetical protein
MYNCDICNMSFNTYRGLNGHKRMHGPTNGGYSVSRKKKILPTCTCKQCGITKTYDPLKSTGQFCSSKCCGRYKIEQTSRELVEKGLVSTNTTLKRYLIFVRGEKCEECNCGSEWNGKPLSLQVDHIDGDSDNNFPSNIRLLCPNCHSQTDTFSARNKKNTKRNKYLQKYKSEKKQK